MKLNYTLLSIGVGFFLWLACSPNSQVVIDDDIQMEIDDIDETTEDDEMAPPPKDTLKILSLGDSYTIGQSVCETCRFPEQLKDSLLKSVENTDVVLKVIARTGWTTSNLKGAIATETITEDYNIATLLIGVNNQFQGISFDVFEKEFPELVNTAIKLAKGNPKNLIVVSIPDYAFTPYGNGNNAISKGIDKYNTFIENYCKQQDITYVYITDITRKGLEQPSLVASDGLHPSELAYSKFIERILPIALEKIEAGNN